MSRILQRKQQFTVGKTDENGTTILYEDAPGGMRKIRCPKCNQFATPAKQADAKNRFTCTGCGTSFSSMRM